MINVVGVRFKRNGKIYYFDPGEFILTTKDNVIVETVRGIEFGYVALANREVPDESVVLPLKTVIRIATEEDKKTNESNLEKAKEIFTICKQKIINHNIEMKLIEVEYTFDGSKILFYFTAEGRVDFRDLVKDLASHFHTRIELRQIGVRDEAKILGGLGICGRPLCCNTFLSEFQPVSIKMAKEQGLSLNPTKIAGTCGRLMCCLKNEQEAYEYLNAKVPRVGSVVIYKGMKGIITDINILREEIKVKLDAGNEIDLITCKADEVKVIKRASADHDTAVDEKALKGLE